MIGTDRGDVPVSSCEDSRRVLYGEGDFKAMKPKIWEYGDHQPQTLRYNLKSSMRSNSRQLLFHHLVNHSPPYPRRQIMLTSDAAGSA
jgi:hypothetical protein